MDDRLNYGLKSVVVVVVVVSTHLLWSLRRPFADPLRLRCRTLSRVRHGGDGLSPTDTETVCAVFFFK